MTLTPPFTLPMPWTSKPHLPCMAASAMDAVLHGYRRRRAWCRGQLFLACENMVTTTRRGPFLPLPVLDWLPVHRQGPPFEPHPWPSGVSIAPDIDHQAYRDRLLRSLQWRYAGYQRRMTAKGPANKPIWLGDYPGSHPPPRAYLRRCHLVIDGTAADLEQVIDAYHHAFHAIEQLYRYYKVLGEQMRTFIAFAVEGASVTQDLLDHHGLQPPTLHHAEAVPGARDELQTLQPTTGAGAPTPSLRS